MTCHFLFRCLCFYVRPPHLPLKNQFQVDVDECEDIAVEYNIMSMPTFVFIKNKQVLTTFSGANYDKLKQTIYEHK